MEYNIANIFTIVFFAALLALWIFVAVKKAIASTKADEKKTVTQTQASAKILFKSVNEYDKTNLTNLTTYHVRELYLDCLIDGEKKTFLCSEYMYNFVQKGETYDVVYTSDHIELDRRYYPENFDEYFVEGAEDESED